MIVVEGADNSGKSVFGKSFGMAYFSAGPAPQNAKELASCLVEQRSRVSMTCVQDRLTCISQQVYSDAPEASLLQRDLLELVDMPNVIVVYCRPPERTLMDFSTHVVKSYDTEENLEKIIRRSHEYIRKYDDLMSKIPHIVYDWTEHDDKENSEIRSSLMVTQMDPNEWRKMRDLMNMKMRF